MTFTCSSAVNQQHPHSLHLCYEDLQGFRRRPQLLFCLVTPSDIAIGNRGILPLCSFPTGATQTGLIHCFLAASDECAAHFPRLKANIIGTSRGRDYDTIFAWCG